MSMIDVTFLTAASATQAAHQPRAVSDAAAQQFREAIARPDCSGEVCAAQPAARSNMRLDLDLDIEKVLTSSMPPASASQAEFAMGLLRTQVKVANMAVAIELMAKTTQSLSQGVQTLTSRS
jgi:hypothetical protein